MFVSPQKIERYNQICQEYYDSILAFCNARMQYRTEDARDCTQQVFQILLEKLPLLDLEDNIHAWLYQVARHLVNRYYEEEKRNAEKILYFDDIPHWEEKMGSCEEDPYQNCEKEEWEEEQLEEIKEDVLKKLDEDSRRLLEMRFQKRLPYKEIAYMLGASENTLRQRVFALKCRVRKNLSELLDNRKKNA